ncbi:hypothetical protein F3K31_21235 [Escherichia coli]|nr:hypothetical protein [uncultured bacterium]QOY16301.1 hypothetical protein F3K31_21235 [Escherichia coli]STH45171.1 protein [Escherichia coli]
MNEVVNSGVMNIASLVVSVVVLLIGLILWFFINRASSRTNEQIELLEALLDQQKRQNALLRRLCEANEPEKADKRPLRVKNRLKTKILFVWSPNDNPSSILSNPVVEGLLNSS